MLAPIPSYKSVSLRFEITMPFLIAAVLIFEIFTKFPYTSVLSIGAVFGWIIWSAQKASRLRKLERQRYLDDVAAFQWDDNMDPIEFERRCAQAMRFAGWTAQTTKGSGDQGVDVLAEQGGIRVVLQCKRYNKSVGNKAVQEAFAAKTFAQAQHAAVVTNSQFTPAARKLAASTGVLLLHFTDLVRPNKLFGLPDVPSVHRPSDVTEAQINKVRQSRRKPAYLLGLCGAIVLALFHDVSKTDAIISPPSPSVKSDTSPTSSIAAPDTMPSPKAASSSTIPNTAKATATPPPIRTELPSMAQAPVKTFVPAFLRDGNMFCTVASDFDKRWRWSLSGDHAHEPSTPSCTLIFGQLHPIRVSVLRRISSNKTMIRVDEGNLAGRTGFTDAFLP